MKKTMLFIIILTNLSVAGLFDDRFPSARGLGMGGAMVALSNDVWSGYYNPAGLADMQNYHVASSYNMPFGYSFFRNYFITGAAGLPEEYGAVSVSFQDFGVNYLGNELSTEYTASLSHGFYLMKDIHSTLSVGYNLKFYHWSLSKSVGTWDWGSLNYNDDGIDPGSGSTYGIDVGAQASLYGRTFIGVYLLNINAPIIGSNTKHDLPQRIVIGAAYKPQSGVTTTLAFNKAVGFDTQVEGGFEFEIIEYLALRLGIGSNPNRFSGGIGIQYEGIQFDYGLRTHPVLAETHLLGLSYIIE